MRTTRQTSRDRFGDVVVQLDEKDSWKLGSVLSFCESSRAQTN